MTRALAALLVFLIPSVIGAQQILNSHLILVAVTDTGNRPLVDLEKDDFVIDERGEAREILSAQLADYPIAVLIDNSTGSRDQLEAMRAAAARFVSRAGERPILVAGLAQPLGPAAAFGADRATVLEAIKHLPRGSGPPAPLEAAALAARAIQETGAPFSAIVVLSAQAVEASPASRGELLRPILESRAAIHAVAWRPSDPSAPPRDDILRSLADQTGGQFTAIYTPASYPFALDRLAERLATEMMIECVLPPGVSPGGDVRVGVKVPGARVRGLGVR